MDVIRRRSAIKSVLYSLSFFVPCLVAFSIIGYGQTDAEDNRTATAEFIAAKKAVSPGDVLELKIRLRFADGAHANSNAPTDPYLIPTSFTPKKSETIEWRSIEYPKPTEAIASYSPTPLEVFEDGAEIKVEVKISETFKEDTIKIEGSLRIQVCDDQQCYPPQRIPVSTDVKIIKGSKSETRPSRPKKS